VKAVESIGLKLKLPASDIDRFVAYERLVSLKRSDNFPELQQLASDTLQLISDRAHYQIMELTRSGEFRPDSRWIARILDLSLDEVNVAITRLLRLGLLEMIDRRQWRASELAPEASHADFARLAVQRLAERLRNGAQQDH
jgi:DNA-binding GntR family transcriptional regulator